MLQQTRQLAEEHGAIVETVEAFAESIPLPSATFDLVVSRLAAHHFKDVQGAVWEMFRLARPGGHIAVIDIEGDEDPAVDAFNHEVEMLHDPTHVRSYTSTQWQEIFRATGLKEVVCETRWRELPDGLTVGRWCELGKSGEASLKEIRVRMVSAPAAVLSALDIVRDPDGEFRIPVRTLLLIGRRPD
jgi:SAM-dependent methyltransferase